MNDLQQYPDVCRAAQALLDQQDYLSNIAIQIQQIPSPTDHEAQCALWVADYFRKLGIAEVKIDDHHNVYARIPGRVETPALMVSAHIDTVFPEDTDLTVRVNDIDNIIFGPSIGDNSAGVAALIALAETLKALPEPSVDVWLVANTGEEGLGDLRGMKAAIDRLEKKIGACIVLEGMGLSRVVHKGLGSRRYEIAVRAPGGHSWSDFGKPSAIHILAQIGAEIASWQMPDKPRSTFNIGRIEGGRSVNTIAQNASMQLDLRSEDSECLAELIARTDALIKSYQSDIYLSREIYVSHKTIGDRPTGQIEAEHPLVQAAVQALHASGLERASLKISSTDANVPLSRQIPAVCVGITEGGGAHRSEEWINSALMPKGVHHLVLLTWWSTLWLAGEVEE